MDPENSNVYFMLNPKWEISPEDGNRMTIVAIYYTLTTLATIGLGDYHPLTSAERLLCAFVLISGITLFSYVLNKLSKIAITGGLDNLQEENLE